APFWMSVVILHPGVFGPRQARPAGAEQGPTGAAAGTAPMHVLHAAAKKLAPMATGEPLTPTDEDCRAQAAEAGLLYVSDGEPGIPVAAAAAVSATGPRTAPACATGANSIASAPWRS